MFARRGVVAYLICVAGQRACPPEDCGGPWSYPDFLEAVSNPGHRRHEERLEWVGGEFDPEKFDLEAVNSELRRPADNKTLSGWQLSHARSIALAAYAQVRVARRCNPPVRTTR